MLLNVTNNGKKVTHINIPIKKTQKETTKKEPEPPKINESLTEIRKDALKNARYEGIYTAAKTGLITNYIVPYALFQGFGSTFIVLLVSLPQLLSAATQLILEKLIKLMNTRFRFLIAAGYLESYVWLAMTLLAALSIKNPLLLMILVILDAILVNIQAPIWNSVLADLIPEERLAKYFGNRNIYVGIAGFIAALLAGILLSKFTNTNPIFGFITIFALAFICARLSVKYQEKVIDINPKGHKTEKYSFVQFIRSAKKNNFGLFSSFYSLHKLVVAIASPFFAIYMLQELNLTYMQFTIIVTATTLSSLAAFKLWSMYTYKYGSKKTMNITAFLIPIIPILWLLTKNWKLIILIEIISGIVWAGFNLSSSTFLFESVKPEKRMKFYTYHKLLEGIGLFVGTMLGNILLKSNMKFLGSAFLLVFLVSAILRLIVAIGFIPRIQEEKVVSIAFGNKDKKKLFSRLITIRPKEGLVFEPIGSSTIPVGTIRKEKEQQKKIQSQ